MKTRISNRRFLKHGMLIVALLLTMGLVGTNVAQSTFAATTSLTTPTITAAGSAGYDAAKIVWSTVAGATSYEVQYATSYKGPYVIAGTSTSNSFTKTKLITGKTYYFKVRAMAVSGTTKIYSSLSGYKAVTPIPSTPAAKAASASYNSIKVSWTAVPGVTGYKIYCGTSATGTFSYRGATANLSYTNISLVTGKTYYYKIIAYRTVNGVQINSKTAQVYARPVPSAPSCSVSTNTATKANISWTGVPGATKYQILRSNSATGTYTLVYTASSTTRSYVNTGLTNGKTYYYKVRAYHLEGSTNVYGYYSTVKSVILGTVYGPGSYKVGTDIPAGEYLLVATNKDYTYFCTSTGISGTGTLKYEASPYPNLYASLTTGEYATFEYVKVYPIASAPKLAVNTDGSFNPAQYKVGRDISAGTYVVNLQDTMEYGNFSIEMDSYHRLGSGVGSEQYRGRIYITLTAGQYFTFNKGTAYPLAIAPALDKSQPYLHDGMYKVGVDIPADTYTITSKDQDFGYYCIYSDATYSKSSLVESGYLDTATKRVTVSEGQYLYVFEGYFPTPSN